MSVNLTINGTSYTFPNTGDESWGDNGTNWATAVSNSLLQKTGGTFTLTADVDFGATFGLKSVYYKSRNANVAGAGIVRLGSAEAISWRNNANSANLPLTTDSSDRLTFNGNILASSGGVIPVASGGTNLSSYTTGDTLYASGSTTLSKLAIGAANTVNVSTGSAPSWALLVNANIDSAAAIARSKIASGTNYRIVANNSSGVMSENAALTSGRVVIVDSNGQLADEATLAVSRGGTNLAAYTAGDILYASGSTTLSKLAIGTAGQVLKVASSLPSWGSAGSLAISASKTANYTLVAATDDTVRGDSSGGTFTFTLPTAVGNDGKVFRLIKTDSSFTVISIATTSSQTINGSTTDKLATQYETLAVQSDGANWLVLDRKTTLPWTAYTPTGTWSTNTTYTGLYRRQGEEIELRIIVTLAGAPTAAGLTMTEAQVLNGLTGLTIDTTKFPNYSSAQKQYAVGTWNAMDAGVQQYGGTLAWDSNSTYVIPVISASGNVSNTGPFSFGNLDSISFFLTLPITNWKA